MNKTLSTIALIFLAFSMILSACSGPAAAAAAPAVNQPAAPVVVQVATATPVPTEAPTQAPTATSTATIMPTAKPTISTEDPAGWELNGSPDPYNAGYMLYTLTDQQQQFALQPIREFYDLMYHSNKLLTPDVAKNLIDTHSPAWTDKEQGFQVSYDSFAKVGYYPYYEFPIEDAAHYTNWKLHGVKTPDGKFYVLVSFRYEEQGYTIFNQNTQEKVVSTPYWGPRLMTLQTAYINGHWLIISRYEEDLNTYITPTPTK